MGLNIFIEKIVKKSLSGHLYEDYKIINQEIDDGR